MTIAGRSIVCVGFADWDAEVWTNQQHLMSRLAQDNTVLFVESLGLRRPQLAGADVRRVVRRLVRGLGGPRERDGVHVLSPLVLPWHRHPSVRALNGVLLRASVRRAARRLGLREIVLWAYVPHAEAVVRPLAPVTVVYHVVDDIGAQKGVDATSFGEVESRFLSHVDLVVTSAPALTERMRSRAAALLEAPNVADTRLFATALEAGPVDPGLADLAGPVLLFTGAVVATKLDVDLLVEVARRHPEWTFVLAGPVGAGDPSTDVSTLRALDNVRLLGPRPQRDLPALCRGADVGVIPYAVNALTRSVFPMKVYEYLAAGLPVVATPLPALDGVADVVTADGPSEFVAAIARLLEREDRGAREARSRRARSHSWEARLDELAEALDAVEPAAPAVLSARRSGEAS
jgi:glycosyltransferase involved in cell wall biosynthesis